MALKLIIGNKNYSSWSLRPWIVMRHAGIAFDEELVPLYEPGSREQVMKYSPTGTVPCLVDGDLTVWESLAILDYLADKFPDKKLWPDDLKARGHARAISSEMHAGFGPLRQHCPMNMRRDRSKPRELPPQVQANVDRIDAIWTQTRSRFGAGGPFLLGAFSNADAMYAPVVSRFASYGVAVTPASRSYMSAMTALPAWKEWEEAGRVEPMVMAGNEV
jgi:glutathione S-transferase